MKVTINHDEEKPGEIIIEPGDLWSLDGTLAEIIAPALKAYRGEHGGFFRVDVEDAQHLAHTYTKGEHEPVAYSKEAFAYVLDEMIWAFEQIAKRELDADTSTKEAYQTYYDRIDNGLRLFGKYYRSLWL